MFKCRKVKTFSDAIVVVTILNCLSAMRNFTDFRKNKSKFISNCIYNIKFIIIVSTSTLYVHLGSHPSREYELQIEQFFYYMAVILLVGGFLSTTSLGLYKSKNVLILWKQMDNVDEGLRELAVEVEYRSFFFRTSIIAFFWALSFMLTAVYTIRALSLSSSTAWDSLGLAIFMFIANVTSYALYEFDISLRWLGLRFKQTNKLLEALLLENHQTRAETDASILIGSKYNFQDRNQLDKWLSERYFRVSRIFPASEATNLKRETADKIYLLHRLRMLHLHLFGVIKMMNKTYDAQLSLYIYTILLSQIIIVYYIYMEIQRPLRFVTHVGYTVLCLTDVICNLSKIVFTSCTCEYTMSQARRTIGIIHTASSYKTDTDFRNEMFQFRLQISQTQLQKSRENSLWLNYNFIRRCVSVMVSYLVIMIQFSQSRSI